MDTFKLAEALMVMAFMEDTMKPDDIPQDVWTIARGCIEVREFVIAMPPNSIARIARAIMAAKAEEREACAKVAAHLNGWGNDFGRGGHADHIAAEIRRRGEA